MTEHRSSLTSRVISPLLLLVALVASTCIIVIAEETPHTPHGPHPVSALDSARADGPWRPAPWEALLKTAACRFMEQAQGTLLGQGGGGTLLGEG